MNEAFQVIFGLLGGLSIFLFGMNMMSESLQKAAGEKMKKILGILTVYIEKLNQKREIAGETMQQTRSEAVCAILKKDLANLYDEIKYDLEPKLTGGFDE